MLKTFALFGAVLFLATNVASAKTVPGLRDLIGARGSSVESELESRGFRFAGNLGSATLWWNARRKVCASVAVDNGRVQSIQVAPARDCGKTGGSASRRTPLNDLIGMDGIRAFDVMTERGFRNVDTISGNNEIYGTFWNASTRECVQMNSRNGRVFGIEKVPSHPKCR